MIHDPEPLISKPNVNIIYSDFAPLDFEERYLLITCDPPMAMTEDMMVGAIKNYVKRMKSEYKKHKIIPKKNEQESYPDVAMRIGPERNFKRFIAHMRIKEFDIKLAAQITDLMFIHYLELWIKNL